MTGNPILPLFVVVVAVVLIVAFVQLFTGGRRGRLAYDRIERLFTPAERSFLGVLEQIVGRHRTQFSGKRTTAQAES
jgi:hypothetical protein